MKVFIVENGYQEKAIGGIASYIRLLIENLREKGIPYHWVGAGYTSDPHPNTVNISLTQHSLSNFNFFLRLFISLKRFPDASDTIYHFHHPYMGLPFLLFKRNARCILTLHGRQDLSFRENKGFLAAIFYQLLCKIAIPKYDLILSDNQQLLDYYSGKYFIEKGKCQLLQVPADLSHFYPGNKEQLRLKHGFSLQSKLVVFAGRVEKGKNLILLIDSFILLQKKMSDVQLIIIGDGRQKSKLKSYVQSNSIEGIWFIDKMNQDMLAEYLNCADVFALTSLHEGGPMIVKEALACNLPVVATDVGDVKEVLEGLANCYISPANADHFAHHLEKVLRSTQKKDYQSVVSKYSADLFGKKILVSYQHLLNSKAAL